MKKLFMITMSSALILSQSSFASKRFLDEEKPNHPQESKKKPRLEEGTHPAEAAFQDILEIMRENPQLILDKPYLRDSLVKALYTGDILFSLIPKDFMDLFQGASSHWGPLNHQYSIIVYKMNDKARAQQALSQETLNLLLRDADRGDKNAQYNLALMYRNGWTDTNGTVHAPDNDKAFEYVTKAAHQGYAPAQSNLKNLFSMNGNGMALPDRPFTLPSQIDEKIRQTVPQIQHLMGMSNPDTQHLESAPNTPLYSCLKVLDEDLKTFESLVSFMNKSGFLMIDINANFNTRSKPLHERSVSSFNVGEESYLCVGRENVAAAQTLLPLLDIMKKHPELLGCLYGFEISKVYLSEDDIEGHENCDAMIGALTKIRDDFKDMAECAREGIVSHASKRAAIFQEMLGL
jgi:TPR repeat protein